MPMIDITDGESPDLTDNPRVLRLTDHPLKVAVLQEGKELGLPGLSLRFDLPDGRIVVYEMTARMFVGIAKSLKSRFPLL